LARSVTIIPREAPTKGRRVESLIEIERKILDFMVQYLRANTYQPSIREIGERFGIKSTKTVSEHLQALADKGFLERDPSRSRGVKILGVDLSAETVSVPCYSEVPNPRGARVAADMHLSVDRRMGGEQGCFIVRADGSDLAVLGVAEGDFVLVSPATVDDLENGSIVVARVGNDSLYHRFSKNGKGVCLQSLNPGGEENVVEDPGGLQLVGRVTAFFRRIDHVATSVNLTPH
jgi:repressor LexA